MNKVVQFEGQEVKVITDEGKVLINLVATAKACGLIELKNNKEYVSWKSRGGIVSKINKILSGNCTKEIQGEIKYTLEEIENTDDRNSIYTSSWLAKRIAMECHSDKAMQYKNFLATLDEQREQSLINTNSDDMVNMVTNTINAIIPQIIQQFVPMMQENKKQIEQSRALLVNQANIYDEDRDNLRTLVGMKSANVTYLTKKLKMVLSDFLGEQIYANDDLYRESKFRILDKFNVGKWEDIPVNKLDDLYKTIENAVDLFDEPLPIKNGKVIKLFNSNPIRKEIETSIIDGIKHMKCGCCEQWKPIDKEHYYKWKGSSTGYKSTCKICKKKYYQENRVARLAYQNERMHSQGTIPRSNYSYNRIKETV